MNIATDSRRLLALLNGLSLLAMMLAIAAILTTAMTLQYAYGELPCPLCLLQRAAMFGVCFGIILHFRNGYSVRNTGVSLLFALFLLIVSVRQTLLDIYPRPSHSYIGSAAIAGFGLEQLAVPRLYNLKLLADIARWRRWASSTWMTTQA
jgi:disulfide bond formation protein DsbB